MKLIAREMNLSETAYTCQSGESHQDFQLKWFTPETEVSLCGHATLATAHIIFSEYPHLLKGNNTIKFHTLSGILTVAKENEKLKMDFPQGKPIQTKLSNELELELTKYLNIPSNDVNEIWFCAKTRKLLVEIKTIENIAKLIPNKGGLLSLKFENMDVRGIIVTCKDGKEYDFVSRYFAPWVGIDEDPVTGSAHTVLAVFWSLKTNNKKSFSAFQASQRGGVLNLELVNDRVLISGNAITVLDGTLRIN